MIQPITEKQLAPYWIQIFHISYAGGAGVITEPPPMMLTR